MLLTESENEREVFVFSFDCFSFLFSFSSSYVSLSLSHFSLSFHFSPFLSPKQEIEKVKQGKKALPLLFFRFSPRRCRAGLACSLRRPTRLSGPTKQGAGANWACRLNH